MKFTAIAIAVTLLAVGALAAAPLATADPVDKVGYTGQSAVHKVTGTGCGTLYWDADRNTYYYQHCY